MSERFALMVSPRRTEVPHLSRPGARQQVRSRLRGRGGQAAASPLWFGLAVRRLFQPGVDRLKCRLRSLIRCGALDGIETTIRYASRLYSFAWIASIPLSSAVNATSKLSNETRR